VLRLVELRKAILQPHIGVVFLLGLELSLRLLSFLLHEALARVDVLQGSAGEVAAPLSDQLDVLQLGSRVEVVIIG
jgi:hypothetical protein